MTTFNTILPGSVPGPAGPPPSGPARMNIQVGVVNINDGGGDAMAPTLPNTTFLEAGVWEPGLP